MLEGLVAPAIAGIVGANAGAFVLNELNLGLLGNSVAGIAASCLLVAVAPWFDLDVIAMGLLTKIVLSGIAGVIAMAAAGLAYNRLI